MRPERTSGCVAAHRRQHANTPTRQHANTPTRQHATAEAAIKSPLLRGRANTVTPRLRVYGRQAECVSSVNAPCPLSSIPDQPFVQYGMDPEGHDLNADPREPTSQPAKQPTSEPRFSPANGAGRAGILAARHSIPRCKVARGAHDSGSNL
ncbi:hypothetical protein EYF80_047439 [Liparis tanakae]|uniref:Uncharacterized protein n=1 Tax=Liparis tanakae TaxID=230148 RepID=A0A4Z2FMM1_9TELE|nr:hypothetical protein EYF80_047439 [Liparis tanakae]